LDDISGAGQTKAAHDLCSGIPPERRFHFDVEGAGHFGIFSGRRWRDNVYPEVRKFIAKHQGTAKSVKAKVVAAKPAAKALPKPGAKPASKPAVKRKTSK
jgi:poly(3-hydroxybutyrate) depolymerase